MIDYFNLLKGRRYYREGLPHLQGLFSKLRGLYRLKTGLEQSKPQMKWYRNF